MVYVASILNINVVANPNLVARVGMEFNGERSTTIFEDTVDDDFTGLYPALISAFQIGDRTLIGKILCETNVLIEERLGELINEGDIIRIGSEVFNLPTFDDVLAYI